jgi:tetratricopeptide (TPR) repeat protein
MNRSVFIFFVLTFFIFSDLKSQTFDEQLITAQQLYSNAKYDSAALIYQSIIDSGYQSPELYYNMGNAYFKLQEIPSAILYYEKALKLKPSDENIQYNLNLCNTLIPDRIESLPKLFFIRWYKSLYNYFPIDTWAFIGLGLLSLFSLFMIFFFLSVRIFFRKLSFWSALLFLLLSFFSFFLTSQKYASFKNHDEAIVFTPSITVKSSPAKNSVDLFVIHEGTKVTILDQVGEWRKIRIQNGSIGWIETNYLQII